MTRTGVAWFAVGCQMGAYEHALRYATERMQFGKPVGGFQARAGSPGADARECHVDTDDDAAFGAVAGRRPHAGRARLALFCTIKCREAVGDPRELLGGNGILLDNHIGRFVADAEAIYTYEGTREMNTLIVGKAITGLSAFVRPDRAIGDLVSPHNSQIAAEKIIHADHVFWTAWCGNTNADKANCRKDRHAGQLQGFLP